ncbi:AAA domain-containing protein [Exiguobacterium oxidotolerans]|uniref:AAA domain-containing protein n=1 Tax=Exiguobacterium oxidotolerans TaxID=223958 RepID=UPI000494447C|nr:AAA domain-containing protein [Exiguobacterium oxidotolerans]
MSTTRSKAINLFQFMAAVKKLGLKTQRDTKTYTSILEETMMDYPNVKATSDDSGQTVVEVKFLPAFSVSRPALPSGLNDWTVQNGEDITPKASLPEELRQTWTTYELAVRDWKDKKRQHEKAQSLYDLMYRMYQFQSTDNDTHEIVWTFGMLHWPLHYIQRPLFARPAVIEFDTEKSVFRIETTPTPAKLELDMLHWDSVWMKAELSQYELDFKEDHAFDFNPWSTDEVQERSEQVLRLLHADHAYGQEADVYVMPSVRLYRRPKSNHGWVEEHEQLAQAIEEELPISPALEQFFTSNDEEIAALDQQDRPQWTAVGEEILFPLPYNEEQKRILQQLSNNAGVVVQGPPGTGKSHTISNLISHLLAHGKRVLVTSEKEHALTVLRDKLPAEIRELAVSVLGADSKTIKQTETSLHGISTYLNKTSAEELAQQSTTIRAHLESIRRDIAKTRRAMIDQAVLEHESLAIGGETKTPLEWAKWVSQSQAQTLVPTPILTETIPLSAPDIQELYALMQDQEALAELKVLGRRPARTAFSEPLRFEELAQEVATLRALEAEAAPVDWMRPASEETKVQTLDWLHQASTTYPTLESWTHTLYRHWLAHPSDAEDLERERAQFEQTLREIERLERTVSLHDFSLPTTDVDLFSLATELVPLFEANKVNGMFFKWTKRKNYTVILDEVTIDGKKVTQSADVALLLEHLTYTEELRKLERTFTHRFAHHAIEIPVVSLTTYRKALDVIRKLDTVLNHFKEVVRPLQAVYATATFSYEQDWLTAQTHALEVLFRLKRLDALDQQQQGWLATLENTEFTHPITARLTQAIRAWDASQYTEVYEELRRIETNEHRASRLQELSGLLEQAAPNWVTALRTNSAPTFHALELRDAWHLAYVKSRLDDLSDADERDQLYRLEQEEGQTVARLCATLAWKEQLKRMTPSKQEQLNSWATLIRKVGKGTGKHASRYRKEAAKQMMQAQDAIPVWIMPVNRVLESFKAASDLFDVIIFDESSQSTMDAISLLSRARKAIIVGDDRQISPTSFDNRDNVEEKRKTYFGDDPTMTLFDGTSSLYSLASVKFSTKVGLREHFRCVPEIIGFSNAHVYEGTIVPLRLPQRAERLNPAVKSHFVSDGYVDERTTDKINLPEARAIVAELKQMMQDPLYAERTFGVVSLLGNAQANQIERIATAEIGIETLMQHHVRFGDAYTFQGDERDVMLLSMVVAPNKRFMAMTKETDSQRFNVAASRARDQMILFHSVSLNDIGNSNCMRYKLLGYCQNPLGDQASLESIKHRFDSPFEEAVYRRLVARGYLVTPQVQVNGYRIDLVVEGEHNRLAVECDGERWHGPDAYEADMFRQKVLERAGWNFWRVRGRHFYQDADRAMESLWTTLEEMEIKPTLLEYV